MNDHDYSDDPGAPEAGGETGDALAGALEELRFDDAAALAVGEAEAARVKAARDVALDAARALQTEMVELGRVDDHRRILDLAADPRTEQLLSLLSPAVRERADLQIRLATRWADERRSTNRRRLNEAAKALAGLDFELARGLLLKIEGTFLDDAGRAERDRLLLDLSARSLEMEELSSQADRLLAQATPPKKKRWFRRG
ncbi:MAG: hypothetical protein ACFCVC_01735 [Acidimicrobiia bacterium]